MTGTMKVAHVPPGARAIRLDDKPTVSVVVASYRGPELLAQCLAFLERQCAQYQAEIVIARPVPRDGLEGLGKRYPAVRWVMAEPHADVPHLRRLGLAAAEGDIVLLTEDHCVAGPNWLGQRLEGTRRTSGVVEAPVNEGPAERVVDWATYFIEYNRSGDVPVEPDTRGRMRLS